MVVDEVVATLAQRYASRSPDVLGYYQQYETACYLSQGPDARRRAHWQLEARAREQALRAAIRAARQTKTAKSKVRRTRPSS